FVAGDPPESGAARRRRPDRRGPPAVGTRPQPSTRGAGAPVARVRFRRGGDGRTAARGPSRRRSHRRAPRRHAGGAAPRRRPRGLASPDCRGEMSALSARIALVGNPNSGKTALFNALTGARQKVANYAGVTVERKEGAVKTPAGRTLSVLDLPGTYSLRARSPDEAVTRDAVLGRLAGETPPDALVAVADATNLRLVLRLILELKTVGRPMVLALKLYDIAQRQGLRIDLDG